MNRIGNIAAIGGKKRPPLSFNVVILLVVSHGITFFAGSLLAMNAGVNKCAETSSSPLRSLQKKEKSPEGSYK